MHATDRDFNHVQQHGNDSNDEEIDDIALNTDNPSNNEAYSRNVSRRLPQEEVLPVLADAKSVLRTPPETTRSQKNATPNNAVHDVDEADDADDGEDPTTLLSTSFAIDTTDSAPNCNQTEPSVSQKIFDNKNRLAFEHEMKIREKRGTFTPVRVISVPRHANIIASHYIFKRKLDST